jgi:hypothetical protein
METKTRISTLTVNWDDQIEGNEGWYVEAQDSENQCVTDSLKWSFPVDVDDYRQDQLEDLLDALHEALPHVEIWMSDGNSPIRYAED